MFKVLFFSPHFFFSYASCHFSLASLFLAADVNALLKVALVAPETNASGPMRKKRDELKEIRRHGPEQVRLYLYPLPCQGLNGNTHRDSIDMRWETLVPRVKVVLSCDDAKSPPPNPHK